MIYYHQDIVHWYLPLFMKVNSGK